MHGGLVGARYTRRGGSPLSPHRDNGTMNKGGGMDTRGIMIVSLIVGAVARAALWLTEQIWRKLMTELGSDEG